MINDATRKGVNLMTKNAVTPISDEEVELDAEAEEISFSAKDLATAAGTDPKSFRRWLRAYTGERADGRWAFNADQRDALLEAYATRNDAPAEANEEADAELPAESE